VSAVAGAPIMSISEKVKQRIDFVSRLSLQQLENLLVANLVHPWHVLTLRP